MNWNFTKTICGTQKNNNELCFQGILSVPLMNDTRLINWTMTGLTFENISWVPNMPAAEQDKIIPPALYVGELVLPPQKEPLNTYVDLTGWGKVRGTKIRHVR